MLRMMVCKNSRFEITREATRSTVRWLCGGSILNILQSVRPGMARFTIEGEGPGVWLCPQEVIETQVRYA
jgi:hypothetical protein